MLKCIVLILGLYEWPWSLTLTLQNPCKAHFSVICLCRNAKFSERMHLVLMKCIVLKDESHCLPTLSQFSEITHFRIFPTVQMHSLLLHNLILWQGAVWRYKSPSVIALVNMAYSNYWLIDLKLCLTVKFHDCLW